jgi:serine/threonine-protein kinase
MVGEYQVEGILGAGAFGTVYRAMQPVIGKLVAIKVLALRFSVDPEMVSRFMAEARAVNQIRHRNIIDIFSFGQLDDRRHYYVMELLEGETLDVILERDHRLTLADALPILRAIGRALDAAHGKGIAHRDLKPENIFIARDDDGSPFPKLLDFGIAKLLAPIDDGLKHKTRTGTPVGTPYYMSPEQCKGRDVDHRTDLYALGVLAYRLVVGEYAFDGDDAMSIMMKQLADYPAPPSTIIDELPRGVDDAIAWLMAKDPADRPACARDAIRALDQAAESVGIRVPTTTWDAQSSPEGRAYRTQPPNTGARVSSGAARQLRSPSEAAREVSSRAPSRRAPVVEQPRRSHAWLAMFGLLAVAGLASGVFVATRLDDRDDAADNRPSGNRPSGDRSSGNRPSDNRTDSAGPSVTNPTSPRVIVTIDGAPDGTEVSVGGVWIGAAPGPVQLPRGDAAVVLTFKVDGYLPQSKTMTPDRDQRFSIALKKKAGGTAPAKHTTKDDLLDPFGGKP